MPPHVVIGSEVYRLVEAQEPEPDAPATSDKESKEEKKSSAKDLVGNVDALAQRVIDELEAAQIESDPPLMSGTREGFRYHVDVAPIGALEQSKSVLYFDFGTSLMNEIVSGNWDEVFSISGLDDLGISQVVWNYEGAQLVATEPIRVKALLRSVAVLQQVDARPRTNIFGAIADDEEDPEKLKDWVLNVAQQMAEHGIGAQGYADLKDVQEAFKQIKLTLDPAAAPTDDAGNPFGVDFIERSIQSAKASGMGRENKTDLNRLIELIEIGVSEKVIKPQLAKAAIQLFKKVEREPTNYFLKDQFFKMVERGEVEGVFSKEEVANARKAIDAFDSDAEWQEALRTKLDKQAPITSTQDEVNNAVEYWATQAGYNMEAGVQAIPTDENTIMARIAAPFPFFYTFDMGTPGKLTLLEAAMLFFDREVFVTPDKGEDSPTQLLKADVSLARALEESISIKMGDGTDPRAPEAFSNQLAGALQGKDPSAPSTEAQPEPPPQQ